MLYWFCSASAQGSTSGHTTSSSTIHAVGLGGVFFPLAKYEQKSGNDHFEK